MKLIAPHTLISIFVQDQDEALHFYTQIIGLEKRSDITFGQGLRLLTVALPGQVKPEIALARPDSAWHSEARVQELLGFIGHARPQILLTENCSRDYEHLRNRGAGFVCAPTHQFYGVEAMFVDPYGNRFVLLEASMDISSLLAQYHTGNAA